MDDFAIFFCSSEYSDILDSLFISIEYYNSQICSCYIENCTINETSTTTEEEDQLELSDEIFNPNTSNHVIIKYMYFRVYHLHNIEDYNVNLDKYCGQDDRSDRSLIKHCIHMHQ
jgi:hypothetical protein